MQFSKIEKLKDLKNYFITKIKNRPQLKTPEKVFHHNNMSFYKRKPVKSGNKKLGQCFGADSKKLCFAKFGIKFVTFLHFFSFSAQKR